ncbi:MAG TPA: dihydrodipicolinate reductase C-terminal domain-containing protein [Candidatus Binatia bacterium]|nr:dihydrodipicolinate reductase C-terminal domain-containing protein [Candidatus Binatia bacterium]
MSQQSLKLVVLGPGKTGSLVAGVARERGHQVQTIDVDVNEAGTWLTPDHLRDVDAVIDFTTPQAVIANIEACLRARKPIVVGTTGWYGEMERIRTAVGQARTGFVFAANFSYGVNLFFQIMKAAAPALTHGYSGHITEVHHIHKKDAPSGTAVAMQRVLEQAAKVQVDITSEREGEVTGTHILQLDSSGDRIVLTHEAKSRRTFAEGAVLAAEWIVGKAGFYDFRDIFAQL